MGTFSSPATMERTWGFNSSTWMAIILAGIVAFMIVAGTLAALNTIGAGNRSGELTTQPAYSRLDDFGLRHAAPFAGGSDSRLDDYGLRHPAPAVVPARDGSGSRPDDYGLRHP